MGETNERRTVVTVEGKITRSNIIDGGNAIEIFSVPNSSYEKKEAKEIKGTQEWLDKYFPIVRASTLSLEDEFLKHEPTSKRQKKTKKKIISAIKSDLCDFRAQRMDPTMDENGNIYYKVGEKPAVGEVVKKWKKKAKDFLPEKNSRLGENNEHYAFLALLIKYLIENENYTVSDAWKAVCDQSKNLGHYRDSKNWKGKLEPTGSRKVGKWYDLGNTYKITVNEKAGGFSIFGGYFNGYGCHYPLVNIYAVYSPNYEYGISVGWLVLDV